MAKRMRAVELEERAKSRDRRLSSVGQAIVNGERMSELGAQREQLRARVEELEAENAGLRGGAPSTS
jgi:cell division protein FtsB